MAKPEIKLAILDDQTIDRELARLACKMCGIECVTYDNANDLLRDYKDYDGAILDYTMPDLTGVAIAEIIRGKSPAYPIIFRSNFAPKSKQYISMLKFGNIISKDMKDGVLHVLRTFADGISSSKDMLSSDLQKAE